MDLREKATQVVADRYLSSPAGMREVQQMQEYFEKENAMIDIGMQIMNLLPALSKPDTMHNSRWLQARYPISHKSRERATDSIHNSLQLRAQHIGLHFAELFDLTTEQKDSLVEGIVKEVSSPERADPDYDDDLPF